MRIDYDEEADSILIAFSNKEPARDESHGWNLVLTFAADEELVQIQILEAKTQGHWPPTIT